MWQIVESSDGLRQGRFKVEDGMITVEANGESETTEFGGVASAPDVLAQLMLSAPKFAPKLTKTLLPGKTMIEKAKKSFALFAGAAALSLLSACAGMGMGMGMFGGLKLSGDQEVPPVMTSASGNSKITVASDGALSGAVTTEGIDGTMAHIHLAAAGKNGPVIVPLTKTADATWSVPAGAKLTAEQLKSYQAGDLYVNVHSAVNKGGEIRAQMKP